MLEGSGLFKSFGSNPVLSDVSIALERGEVMVLVGPSGSGKTTLLKILSMLEEADAGTVLLDGVQLVRRKERRGQRPPFRTRSAESPWPRVTAVFQQLFLWPHLTLEQNITLPIRVSGRAVKPELFEELVEVFGMAEFLCRYPNEVSGGRDSGPRWQGP